MNIYSTKMRVFCIYMQLASYSHRISNLWVQVQQHRNILYKQILHWRINESIGSTRHHCKASVLQQSIPFFPSCLAPPANCFLSPFSSVSPSQQLLSSSSDLFFQLFNTVGCLSPHLSATTPFSFSLSLVTRLFWRHSHISVAHLYSHKIQVRVELVIIHIYTPFQY